MRRAAAGQATVCVSTPPPQRHQRTARASAGIGHASADDAGHAADEHAADGHAGAPGRARRNVRRGAPSRKPLCRCFHWQRPNGGNPERQVIARITARGFRRWSKPPCGMRNARANARAQCARRKCAAAIPQLEHGRARGQPRQQQRREHPAPPPSLQLPAAFIVPHSVNSDPAPTCPRASR